jgi:two-component system nitrate/nitrite response regulator NarL
VDQGARVRILLADEHRMIRDGLRAILEKEGLQIVGEVAHGGEVVEKSCSLRPMRLGSSSRTRRGRK